MVEAVELQNVGFAYAQDGFSKNVLKNVSFSVCKGEFAGIMGKTGCGKTTLLLALNGIVPKLVKGSFQGNVLVEGKDVSQKSVQEMSTRIAYVFQDPNDQIFSLTAFEEVAFALKLRKLGENKIKKRVENALLAVGLEGFQQQDPTTLSQGQKQKLAIATAIAMDTPIIVLDEPIASLDYESAKHVYAILKKLNKQGKTIIVAEHDPEFLYANASKILVLDGGKIAAEGSKTILKSKLMGEFGLRRLK